MRRTSITAAALLLASGGPALAHPKLLSATPAPNATVATTNSLRLRFSERLIARFSKADLSLTSTPTARLRGPIALPAKTVLAPGGKTLVLATAKPLIAGDYRLGYHVTSVDRHRVRGSYVFTVK